VRAGRALARRASAGSRWFDGWMDRWGLALLCTGVIALSVWLMPTYLEAAHNKGTFGTFTAVSESCSRGGCDWSGRYVSSDRTIRLDDVSYDGDGVDAPGDTVDVQWLPSDSSSVYSRDDTTWRWTTITSVACAAYLVWWFVKRRWRKPADAG